MGLHKYIFVAKLWTPFKAKKAIKASLDDIWIFGPMEKIGLQVLKKVKQIDELCLSCKFSVGE